MAAAPFVDTKVNSLILSETQWIGALLQRSGAPFALADWLSDGADSIEFVLASKEHVYVWHAVVTAPMALFPILERFQKCTSQARKS
jgi:hypothetical protein